MNRPAAGLKKYLLPAVFGCLVALPVLYYGLNSELARWKAARAQIQYDGRQFQDAITIMQEAVAQSPHDQDLKLNLAAKLMKHGRAGEALEIIDEVVEVSVNRRPAVQMRSECLMYLGRAEQSLEALKQVSDYLDSVQIDQPNRLNSLAYFRALAGVELKQAESDIDDAINILRKAAWWSDKHPMAMRDQTLVAATMIARRVNCSGLVFELLNRRIDEMGETLRAGQQAVSRGVYEKLDTRTPFDKDQEQEIQKDQIDLNSWKQFLAILYSVRALIHQDRGDGIRCDLDRLATRRLDHDSDVLVQAIRDDWNLLKLMNDGAQYLDTRAMVDHAQRKNVKSSLRDLNMAVLAMELLRLSHEGPVQNTIHDERGNTFSIAKIDRSEATIRGHRAKVYLRSGFNESADADFKRIKELGFDRNEILF